MKSSFSGKLAIVLLIIVCSLFLSCGNGLFGPSMPSELIGTWSGSGAYSYVEEFTFTSSEVSYYGYSEDYPGEFDAWWDGTLKEVYEDDAVLQLDDDMYLAYHVTGDTLYLYKTNPHADYPDLPSEWWNGSTVHYTLHRD